MRSFANIGITMLFSLGTDFHQDLATPVIRISDTEDAHTEVCVLGMHRSGTSVLAGCLGNYGLYLGEVVREAPHNKEGNNENLAVRALLATPGLVRSLCISYS